MKAELLKSTTDAELEKYCSREEVLVTRGIREVVKWIEKYFIKLGDTPSLNFYNALLKRDWQAFKKKRGVE